MKNIILSILKNTSRKTVSQERLRELAAKRTKELRGFEPAVKELLEEGELIRQHGALCLSSRLGLLKCEVVKVNQTFGFVRNKETEEDLFVPGRALLGAMPGDQVLVRSMPSRGSSPEGEIVAVTKPVNARFTGVFHREKGRCEVEPDTMMRFPLKISQNHTGGAKNGDKVLCEITRRGERHYDHRAKVVEVFGKADSAYACCAAILAVNDIPLSFPEDVAAQAREIGARSITEAECAGRLDLRGTPIFTIDSADTKDIDDAISVKRTDTGYELGVHIADVSHYVTEKSALDREAYARGTSVYYADMVVPMLPKELSNGICSLNEGVDRLAFSALLTLDPDGKIAHYAFHKSVIRSRVKGVYSEINALLAGEASESVMEKYAEVREELTVMRELAAVLSKRRFGRGSLDIESSESKIVLDQAHRAVEIKARDRGLSEQMIEDFMLCANEAAASLARKAAIPFVFRVHEEPSDEKLAALALLLRTLGIDSRRVTRGVAPIDLSRILEQSRESPYHQLVNHQLLRSMAKAKYSEVCIGHYGLVLQNYCHFTSPIRRYPDLAIHRILTRFLSGMSREKLDRRYTAFAHDAAIQSSERELRAMTAERECEDAYKAEYMSAHLGEKFTGIISSVAPHGIYVELPNTIEGLIRTASFPQGNYEYHENLEYRDTLSGRKYRIGDTVQVIAAGADVSQGHVDFLLTE